MCYQKPIWGSCAIQLSHLVILVEYSRLIPLHAHVLRKHSFRRKLIVRPSLMSWRWLRYNDVKQPLALTDKDRLNGAQEPLSVPDGKYWALQMEFTLPTSTYATMALREVLRCDTSSAHQSTLNQEWGLAAVGNLQHARSVCNSNPCVWQWRSPYFFHLTKFLTFSIKNILRTLLIEKD